MVESTRPSPIRFTFAGAQFVSILRTLSVESRAVKSQSITLSDGRHADSGSRGAKPSFS